MLNGLLSFSGLAGGVCPFSQSRVTDQAWWLIHCIPSLPELQRRKGEREGIGVGGGGGGGGDQ